MHTTANGRSPASHLCRGEGRRIINAASRGEEATEIICPNRCGGGKARMPKPSARLDAATQAGIVTQTNQHSLPQRINRIPEW
ncbi:hypothetical protein MRX96_022846 [Rhipicephalus microplus]